MIDWLIDWLMPIPVNVERPYLYQFSMTLCDLWPRFHGHNIFRHWISQGGGCFKRSATPCIPRGHGPSAPQFWAFSHTYAYTAWPRTTKFGVVINTSVARFVSDRRVYLYSHANIAQREAFINRSTARIAYCENVAKKLEWRSSVGW